MQRVETQQKVRTCEEHRLELATEKTKRLFREGPEGMVTFTIGGAEMRRQKCKIPGWSNTECKAVPPPIQSAKQTSPLKDYPSRLHVQERLNKIQLEVEEEARQVTELTLNGDVTFNIDIEEINIEPIRELMRVEIYNKKIEQYRKERKGEMKRLTDSQKHLKTPTKTPIKDKRKKQFPELGKTREANTTPKETPKTAKHRGAAVKGDVALLINPQDKGDRGPLKILKDRITELGKLLEDAEEGDLEYLMTATKTFTSQGSNEESNKMIYLLLHDEDESVVDEGPRLYELLTKLRDATISEGRGHVYLATPEIVNIENVGKITECVFQNSKTEVTFLTPAGKAAPHSRIKRKSKKETITETATGKSYAELLRTVTQGVDIKHLGLTVEGDKDKANILVKEIRKNVAEAEVKTGDITIAISANSYYAIATTDEEALASATGEKEENVKLRSLEPGNYDDQTAVVAMPRTPALTMLKQGRLRVCWISGPNRRTQSGPDAVPTFQKDGGAGEASSYYATDLKIIQANLNRSREAYDLVFAITAEKNVDLLIVSEPNKKLFESQAWLKDERGDVAALFLNKSVEVNKVRRKRGILCIHLSHCCMIMIYISPNTGSTTTSDNFKKRWNTKEAVERNSAWWVT
ncbi:hypothetical protein JTB14_027532 [Gonioctena quinquepunctata]|nr:hypothetical protein JTB14_027532 [Gonioctena quinquepunctata]